MKAISLRKMVIAVVIIGVGAGYVRADKQQLQAKLSKDVEIQLKDVTVAEALEKIGQTAGVKIVLSDEAVWKLPLGTMTKLSVSLTGPLADSLAEMLNAFFMRYAVGDEEITIYPRQELEHILGRPNTKQLELLKAIYTRTTRKYQSSIRIINELLGQEVLVIPVDCYRLFDSFMQRLKVEVTAPEGTKLAELKVIPPGGIKIELATPITVAQLLESAKSTWTWYLSGMDFPNQVPEIRLVSEPAFREAKLDQVVDVSFKDERADVILQRLAGWTGMELFVIKDDPSWLEEIIVVDMQNITLRQALRNIVSSVDGEINISNAMYINGPRHRQKVAVPAKTKSSGGAGEGYVGKISIPMEGGKYFIEFMLRESDLTEELKKLREEKIKEILRKVGKAGDKAPEIAARPQSYPIWN